MDYNSQLVVIRNVIVFGDTGSGKSSLIQLFKTSDQNDNRSGPGPDLSYQSETTSSYSFLEIAPLTNFTKVSKCTKFSNARKLIKHIKLFGVHLLVFVARKGRITKAMEENYNIIVNSICLKQVPVLFAISHCENEQNLGEWWQSNAVTFRNQGMHFSDGISTCLVLPGNDIQSVFAEIMTNAYNRSKVALPQKFAQFALDKSWKASWWQWFKALFKCFYNIFFSAAISNREKGLRRITETSPLIR